MIFFAFKRKVFDNIGNKYGTLQLSNKFIYKICYLAMIGKGGLDHCPLANQRAIASMIFDRNSGYVEFCYLIAYQLYKTVDSFSIIEKPL